MTDETNTLELHGSPALEKRMQDGRPVLPWNWRALELVVEKKGGPAIVRKLNAEGFKSQGGLEITYAMLRSLRVQDWFVQECKSNTIEAQQHVIARINQEADVVADAFIDVMKGDEKYQKGLGSAVMQGTKILFEAGDNPLINRRPQTTINNHKQINILSVDSKRFENLSQEQMNEYARTGELPVEDGDGA